MLYHFEILVEALKLIAESLLDDHWDSETSSLKGYKLHSLHHRTFAAFSVKVVMKLHLHESEVIFNKTRHFFRFEPSMFKNI